jgi:hypothetical protein
MILADFWTRWVWPAGGSGGIPGDVVGTLVWVVIASACYPPVRRALEDAFDRKLKHHLDAHHDRVSETVKAHLDAHLVKVAEHLQRADEAKET